MASTPHWNEMWDLWHAIAHAADQYLDTLTSDALTTHLVWQDEGAAEDVGISLLSNIYHYWFHTGEAYAIRQMLGHEDLPQFIGDMSEVAYGPEG